METNQNNESKVVVEEESITEKATKATEDLYHIRDTYFSIDPQDKITKLQNQVDLALNLVDSIPLEQRKSTSQRANYEFLRGKILDVFPDYRKEAEDHLSKAVKLNPSFADAWLCLGNCIWKKDDLISAKNCFNLALNKGPNKKILCQLSMLERRLSQGTENQVQIVEDSIRHAKEAIALDVKDGNSWYNLGNACLTSFFVTGACDHRQLLQSLKSYQNAEKDEAMKSNPDLYFNSATVNKYLENYERALTGFEAAALKDPGLNATEEVQKMVTLLDKLVNCSKGQVRGKRFASLVSSLSLINLNSSHRKATIRLLSEGLNKEVAVIGKVLLSIKHDNVAPLYYLLCDSEKTFFILSVYGIRADVVPRSLQEFWLKQYLQTLCLVQRRDFLWNYSVKKTLLVQFLHDTVPIIIEGAQLTLVAPYFRDVNFSWNSKEYQFKSIRVDFLEQVMVNGKALAPHQAVSTSIYAQHKP